MLEICTSAQEEIGRVNARLAQVAKEYDRSRMQRSLLFQAGDLRRAKAVTHRLRSLNTELAYLASQLREWDNAQTSLGRRGQIKFCERASSASEVAGRGPM